MWRSGLLLALACNPPQAITPSPDPAPYVAQLGWTFAAMRGEDARLPDAEGQAAAARVERELDAAVVPVALARAQAGADLLAGLCEQVPRIDEGALARLAEADAALRAFAVRATVASAAGGPAGGDAAALVLDGPLGRFVAEHRRAAMPPFERLPPIPAEGRGGLEAAERARSGALDTAVGAWRQALATWDPHGAHAEEALTATLVPLRAALEANQRARAADALALVEAVAPEDRARVLLSRGFRAWLGAAPVSEMWGFLLHRGGAGAAGPARGVGPPGNAGPGPGDAQPPGVFAPGTGNPDDFPTGTGDPSQLPAVPPADVPLSPDGVPPPPEDNPTPGPVEGPAPPSVEPPPDGAMQPPPPPVEDQGPPPPDPPPPDVNAGQPPPGEDGFNGVRPG